MDSELRTILEQMRSDLAKLSARLERLENGGTAAVEAQPVNGHAPSPVEEPVAEEGISEETLVAISAAIAAYLGERVHIRQIRLISTSAWAQVGRASVQASHHVH
jgi:methylmalonyl-CoA carboxyltransferase large subunit